MHSTESEGDNGRKWCICDPVVMGSKPGFVEPQGCVILLLNLKTYDNKRNQMLDFGVIKQYTCLWLFGHIFSSTWYTQRSKKCLNKYIYTVLTEVTQYDDFLLLIKYRLPIYTSPSMTEVTKFRLLNRQRN